MLWLIVIAVVIVWGIGRFYLRGEDLAKFDEPRDPPVVDLKAPSAEHHQVVDALASYGLGEPEDRTTPRRARLAEQVLVAEADLVEFDATFANG